MTIKTIVKLISSKDNGDRKIAGEILLKNKVLYKKCLDIFYICGRCNSQQNGEIYEALGFNPRDYCLGYRCIEYEFKKFKAKESTVDQLKKLLK